MTAGKTLLNLDTEDWGEIFIGCAGGGDSMITLPVQHMAVSADKADAYTIRISGMHLRPIALVRMLLACACTHVRMSAASLRSSNAPVSQGHFRRQFVKRPVHAHTGQKHVLLDAAGLMGGHSGLNINEDRGNAVRFVAQVTNAVLKAAPNARLARISGGDKRNAIPREASAEIVVGLPHPACRAVSSVF